MAGSPFEAVTPPSRESAAQYKKRAANLSQQLLEAQRCLKDFPVVVVFAGVDGAGKGECVNRLNQWMDPRWVATRAYSEPSDEERERPEFWRYWRDLPPRGQVGFFLSAWYHTPLMNAVHGREPEDELRRRAARIRAFEQMLLDGGAELVKVWLYLGREEQEQRFRALEADPLEQWRVRQRDWAHLKLFDRFVQCSERLIEATQLPDAAWTVVHGGDARARDVEVGTMLRDAILRRLPVSSQMRALRAEGDEDETEADESAATPAAPRALRICRPDGGEPVRATDYQTRLAELRARLNRAHRAVKLEKRSAVLVFEGWDAAGKGGTIRRLVTALDARDYKVVPIAAPTDEECQHHYLWRFWRHLPRAGRVTIFDRSWYGRVLVERVEELAAEAEWRRAYAEINEFEKQLVESGAVLCKFWLDITREEQRRRFRAREKSPRKQWKLSEEDWRNRARWRDYELAVRDMLRYTSGPDTHWTVVESIDKRFARIQVLEEVCNALERVLGRGGEDESSAGSRARLRG